MTIKGLIAGLALMGLAGCGVTEVDAIRTIEPAGTDFSKALTREYQELAVFEADEMYDWISAVRYAEKGLGASHNEIVLPFELSDFYLPADKIDVLTDARADLLTVLNASARAKVPAAAAYAQGKFDCWVEQQQENHQFDHIAACREAFYAAMRIIDAEMTLRKKAEPTLVPIPAAPKPLKFFSVYFAFDSAAVDQTARDTLSRAIMSVKQYDTPVMIIGHTDTAGPAVYNLALSKRRAQAVADAFVKSSIPETRIETQGVGEADLAKPTDDNVKERLNRRVTIGIE